jgi:hypothetical protein
VRTHSSGDDRRATVNSRSSSNDPLITAGWHMLVQVWDGQQICQDVDDRRSDRHWEATSVNAEASF